MANKHASLDALFIDIADAIREKTGETDTIAAAQFPSIIKERLQGIPTVTLISFSIAETRYQAEEGMTWFEWTNSSYNTDGYKIVCPDGVTDYVCDGSDVVLVDATGYATLVTKDDVVSASAVYGMGPPVWSLV